LAGLRVAVVGSGPAGSYAALELLERGAEVDVYERQPAPLGLVRFGVAPDHTATKAISAVFPYDGQRRGLTLHLGVDVGTQISNAELLTYHHAVIYATGASVDRRLGIEGEDLPGSHSATQFVAWYNGHPDTTDLTFDLSSERAVIVGNGNVALDVARILLTDPNELARTDIADHALAALRESAVTEVVVLGRRGPVQAAYSVPELVGLLSHSDFDVVTFNDEVRLDEHSRALIEASDADPGLRMKVALAQQRASESAQPGRRRLVLRYLVSPTQLLGSGRVEAVQLVHNAIGTSADQSLCARPTDRVSILQTGLVFTAVGTRGTSIAGLPFDPATGTIPNAAGRVVSTDSGAGTYVAGWIKRGSSGVIGTNKQCAAETIARLAEDYTANRLTAPTAERQALAELLAERCGYQLGLAGWARIDAAERAAGVTLGRPRVKFVDRTQLMTVAAATSAATDALP
jgi:ferredoxin--NADP+ reductase